MASDFAKAMPDKKAQRHKVGNLAGNNYGSRYLAAQIIGRWLTTGEFPSRMLAAVDRDRAFITELVYGVVRWKRLLEWVAKQLARQKPAPALSAFLLTGLYQILMMENVAEYAAVNETVAAAKKTFSSRQADFINAVLRRTISEKEQIQGKIQKLPAGIKYSHPDILINRWRKTFGTEETQRLCAWNNSRANAIIRLNTMRPENFPPEAEAGRLFSDRTASGEQRPYLNGEKKLFRFAGSDLFFKAPRGIKVEDLPGYREGLFLVIDPFAQNAVDLLAPRPGERALDACAAPGGKTFLIAEKMGGQGRLVALDASAERLEIMAQNLKRLQIANFVEVKNADLLRQNPFGNEKFDRILADVPCSNTGVIRRKPDVRWNFSMLSLHKLAAIQYKMLATLAPLLKTGGRLVYSTCSLEPEENQLLVASWLDDNPGFCLREERHFFPPESGTDGGYAAKIEVSGQRSAIS